MSSTNNNNNNNNTDKAADGRSPVMQLTVRHRDGGGGKTSTGNLKIIADLLCSHSREIEKIAFLELCRISISTDRLEVMISGIRDLSQVVDGNIENGNVGRVEREARLSLDAGWAAGDLVSRLNRYARVNIMLLISSIALGKLDTLDSIHTIDRTVRIVYAILITTHAVAQMETGNHTWVNPREIFENTLAELEDRDDRAYAKKRWSEVEKDMKRIAALEEQARKDTDELEMIDMALAKAQVGLEHAQSQHQITITENSRLRQDYSRLETTARAWVSELDEAKTELDILRESVKTLTQKNRDLTMEAIGSATSASDFQSLRQACSRKSAELEDTKNEVTEYRRLLDISREAERTQTAVILELRQKLIDAETSANNFQQLLTLSREAEGELHARNIACKDRQSELSMSCIELDGMNKELKTELEETKKKLAAAQPTDTGISDRYGNMLKDECTRRDEENRVLKRKLLEADTKLRGVEQMYLDAMGKVGALEGRHENGANYADMITTEVKRREEETRSLKTQLAEAEDSYNMTSSLLKRKLLEADTKLRGVEQMYLDAMGKVGALEGRHEKGANYADMITAEIKRREEETRSLKKQLAETEVSLKDAKHAYLAETEKVKTLERGIKEMVDADHLRYVEGKKREEALLIFKKQAEELVQLMGKSESLVLEERRHYKEQLQVAGAEIERNKRLLQDREYALGIEIEHLKEELEREKNKCDRQDDQYFLRMDIQRLKEELAREKNTAEALRKVCKIQSEVSSLAVQGKPIPGVTTGNDVVANIRTLRDNYDTLESEHISLQAEYKELKTRLEDAVKGQIERELVNRNLSAALKDALATHDEFREDLRKKRERVDELNEMLATHAAEMNKKKSKPDDLDEGLKEQLEDELEEAKRHIEILEDHVKGYKNLQLEAKVNAHEVQVEKKAAAVDRNELAALKGQLTQAKLRIEHLEVERRAIRSYAKKLKKELEATSEDLFKANERIRRKFKADGRKIDNNNNDDAVAALASQDAVVTREIYQCRKELANNQDALKKLSKVAKELIEEQTVSNAIKDKLEKDLAKMTTKYVLADERIAILLAELGLLKTEMMKKNVEPSKLVEELQQRLLSVETAHTEKLEKYQAQLKEATELIMAINEESDKLRDRLIAAHRDATHYRETADLHYSNVKSIEKSLDASNIERARLEGELKEVQKQLRLTRVERDEMVGRCTGTGDYVDKVREANNAATERVVLLESKIEDLEPRLEKYKQQAKTNGDLLLRTINDNVLLGDDRERVFEEVIDDPELKSAEQVRTALRKVLGKRYDFPHEDKSFLLKDHDRHAHVRPDGQNRIVKTVINLVLDEENEGESESKRGKLSAKEECAEEEENSDEICCISTRVGDCSSSSSSSSDSE